MTVQNKITLTFALILTVSLFVFGYFFLGGVFGGTTFGVSNLTSPITPSAPDLDVGLVGHWTFDENYMDLSSSTEEVLDRSGQDNNGDWVNHATTTVQGKLGQAIDFDGSNDYVNTKDINFAGTALTVSAWVKFDTIPVNSQSETTRKGIVVKYDASGSEREFMIELGVAAEGLITDGSALQWNVQELATSVDSNNWMNSVTDFVADTWYHVVGTFESATVMNIYVDGQLDSTKTSNVATDFTDTAQTLWIGDGPDDMNLDGIIDDVRIYNRALRADEVRELYDLGGVTRAGSTIKSQSDLEDGLVGHWTFDGVLETQIDDQSGQGNTGYFIGGATSSAASIGKIGQALQFDGVDDGLNTGTDTSLDVAGGDATWAAWIYPQNADQATNYNEVIFDKEQGSGGSGGIFIYLENNTLCIYVGTPSCGNINVPNNKWTHIVLVNSGSAAIPYINGVSDIDLTWTGGSQSNVPQAIGYDYNNSGREYDGSIDDVRIYNRALSADEITRLYKLGATTKIGKSIKSQTDLESGLVGHWTFDGVLETQIDDKSGQGNVGYFSTTSSATSTMVTIGKIGQGVQFDGVDDYADIDDSASLDIAAQVSVSVWLNLKSLPTGGDGIGLVGKWGLSVNNRAYLLHVGEASVDPEKFVFLVNDSAATQKVVSASSIQTDTWYHVTGIADGTNVRIYINGVEEGTPDTYNGTIKTHNNPVLFGRIRIEDTVWKELDGTIDDVRIYNRALSADEIQRLYDLGR